MLIARARVGFTRGPGQGVRSFLDHIVWSMHRFVYYICLIDSSYVLYLNLDIVIRVPAVQPFITFFFYILTPGVV